MRRYCLPVLSVMVLFGLTSTPVRADADIRIREKPAPRYLNPSPNPLQFPTSPKEVRIQGTMLITLQQAQELTRHNSWSLQAAQLTGERSLAVLRQQQATPYPTLGVSTKNTRFSGRQ